MNCIRNLLSHFLKILINVYLCQMARKREERAARSAHRAARKARAGQNGTDPNYASLKQQLIAMGLTLREIPGDG